MGYGERPRSRVASTVRVARRKDPSPAGRSSATSSGATAPSPIVNRSPSRRDSPRTAIRTLPPPQSSPPSTEVSAGFGTTSTTPGRFASHPSGDGRGLDATVGSRDPSREVTRRPYLPTGTRPLKVNSITSAVGTATSARASTTGGVAPPPTSATAIASARNPRPLTRKRATPCAQTTAGAAAPPLDALDRDDLRRRDDAQGPRAVAATRSAASRTRTV